MTGSFDMRAVLLVLTGPILFLAGGAAAVDLLPRPPDAGPGTFRVLPGVRSSPPFQANGGDAPAGRTAIGSTLLPSTGERGTAPADLVTIEEFGGAPAPEPEEPPERVLATLYGRPITDADVVRELWDRRGRETFDWIVGRELLRRELTRNDLSVSDRELEERLEEHLESLRLAFPGLRRPDDLTRAASGMPLDEYRDRTVWVELALRKIMRIAMKPDDEKLRSFHADVQADFVQPERVRVSQIFIPPEPAAEAEGIAGPEDWRRAERQILEAHNRLRLGESFHDVARTYGSGGQTSRWVGRGELLRELEEAAFGIGIGSVTTPIRTGMGFHILTVEEKRERKAPRFEEVREEVLARFEEEQFVRLAGEFMARLKANALKNGGLVIEEAAAAFDGDASPPRAGRSERTPRGEKTRTPGE